MKSITASKARADLFNLIKGIVLGHQELKITTKNGSAILISEEDYDNLIETLELQSEPGFKNSIKEADKDIKNGNIYKMDDIL